MQGLNPSNESRVVNGERYSVETSTLLAHDRYWDGHNFERHGRNTFLYKTGGGAYFRLSLSLWSGERDDLVPLGREDAMELYEDLPEHEVAYEEAFDAVVEEAADRGRPTYYDKPMRQTAIWLPEEMIDWLKSQERSMSEVMRNLIRARMSEQ